MYIIFKVNFEKTNDRMIQSTGNFYFTLWKVWGEL